MKKRLAGFMFALFPVILIGQTLLTQDFSGGVMPPTGWTISALPAQWSSSQTNLAGGTAPEAKFTYTSGTNTSRLISPNINTTGKTQLYLDFRQYLDHYDIGYTVGLATRASNGTWHNVWTINPTGNLGPELKSILISNSDVGSATFQFCFFITGNLYNIDYWYFDNIILYAPYNLDAALQNITTPVFNADYEEASGTLKNSGLTTISSLEINYQIDNGEIYVTQYSGLNIPFNSIYSFTCSPLMHLPMGSYVLKVWIDKVNGTTDNDPSNNLLTKTIQIICHTVASKPCFEEFTSSTCPPCATFNTIFCSLVR